MYDAFLTHTWADDDHGRNNHERVARVNEKLGMLGFKTWFDGQRMVGRIEKQMADGIRDSKVVLVFVTRRYMEKVEDEDDNCAKEFGLAVHKGLKYIVPIVMEDALLNPKKWKTGVVTMNLGTKLFVPMTKDSDIAVDSEPMHKLLDILAGLGVKPRQ
eukprot:jgi/Mesvir1/20886/Mv07963-RA.1